MPLDHFGGWHTPASFYHHLRRDQAHVQSLDIVNDHRPFESAKGERKKLTWKPEKDWGGQQGISVARPRTPVDDLPACNPNTAYLPILPNASKMIEQRRVSLLMNSFPGHG